MSALVLCQFQLTVHVHDLVKPNRSKKLCPHEHTFSSGQSQIFTLNVHFGNLCVVCVLQLRCYSSALTMPCILVLCNPVASLVVMLQKRARTEKQTFTNLFPCHSNRPKMPASWELPNAPYWQVDTVVRTLKTKSRSLEEEVKKKTAIFFSPELPCFEINQRAIPTL